MERPLPSEVEAPGSAFASAPVSCVTLDLPCDLSELSLPQ